MGAQIVDKIIEAIAPTVLTFLNLNRVLSVYAVISTICVYFLRQRIKLLKEQNAFSETRRTAAVESLTQAIRCRDTRSDENARVIHPSGHEYDILLIDDEEAILSYKELIEQQIGGSRVRTARNAEQALKEIQRRAPSIIITDIVMPIMDGHALLKTRRE